MILLTRKSSSLETVFHETIFPYFDSLDNTSHIPLPYVTDSCDSDGDTPLFEPPNLPSTHNTEIDPLSQPEPDP